MRELLNPSDFPLCRCCGLDPLATMEGKEGRKETGAGMPMPLGGSMPFIEASVAAGAMEAAAVW